ncbi:MAG: hydrogenase maturation protease [Gammaproteobacteria bacterium]|nr:hydrogenase maturation protease [Gammaproteobacteria bacterium]NNJ71574.1 hydrogenase maturation protease [Enterobacterales bacterium]
MANRTLIFGFGNMGRQDDGLGVLLATHIKHMQFLGVDVDMNYQLNAEDALKISDYDMVIFADASVAIESSFELMPLEAESCIAFSTHAMTPGSILAMAEQLYDAKPKCYVLHIRGYEWEFGAPLSAHAKENLELTKAYIEDYLLNQKQPAA